MAASESNADFPICCIAVFPACQTHGCDVRPNDPREAYAVRPACWRFRTTQRARKREQAPRTPYASRVTPSCKILAAYLSSGFGGAGASFFGSAFGVSELG